MSQYQLLYGFAHAELETARIALENALSCRFEQLDSYQIGDYCRGVLTSGVTLRLRRNDNPLYERNIDPPEERFAMPEYSGYALLLEISGPLEVEDRTRFANIAGISLLWYPPD